MIDALRSPPPQARRQCGRPGLGMAGLGRICIGAIGLVLIGTLAAGPARAQLVLPGAQAPTPAGTPQAAPPVPPSSGMPGGSPGQSGQPPALPPAPKPVGLETVLGREMKRNGREGTIRIERAGKPAPVRAAPASPRAGTAERRPVAAPGGDSGGLVAHILLEGRSLASPGETCAIDLGGEAAVPLTPLGTPAGLARYRLEAPACPLVLDVTEGALLVSEPVEACRFVEANCQAEPRGFWGPEPRALIGQASQYEQARPKADAGVRDGYRLLAARAGPGQSRAVVAEQASFSADRETACRDYAAEDRHGFCHLRYTEIRAIALRARLSGPAAPAGIGAAPR